MHDGSVISHYRIISQLGRGGMGIVYLAEDTKLARKVALKLLPPHALASEDDRARFYREARATASLNHPNIAHVYEIDESFVIAAEAVTSSRTPPDAEKRPFIAMEYIDGETLTERIAKGPLPLKDAVSIATQVADGLKAAHDKNIVHRDIKSGNVMLTGDGVPKILDFGLAKTAASTKLTQMGSTLGTFAYMSPEQARGEEVDGRSDLWSLGVILYEMLTGQMPFTGDYEQAIIYGILNSDPEPVTALRTGVPMELERIIDKLLEKDPSRRYAHADEVAVDLGRIELSGSGRQTVITPSREVKSGNAQPLPNASRLRHVVFVAAVLLAVAAGWLFGREQSSKEAETMHLRLRLPETLGVEAVDQLQGHVALSPDGRRLALGGRLEGRRHLFLHEFAQASELVPLEGTADGVNPVFSPDGTSIAFLQNKAIKKVSLRGGAPQTIQDRIGDLPGLTWSEDGDILYVPDYGDGIYRVSSSGGAPKLLVEPDLGRGEVGFTSPQLLPGGKHLLCLSYGSGFKIIAVSLESKERTVLFEGAISPRYIEGGILLFVQKNRLLGAAFDPKTLEVGEPIGLVQNMLSNPAPMVSQYDVSSNGDLVYLSGATLWDSDLVEVRRDGTRTVLTNERRGFGSVSASPFGTKLALQILDGIEESEIWILDLNENDFRRFGTSRSWDGRPVWFPDGSALAFSSERGGSSDIYVQSLDALTEPRVIVSNEFSKYALSVSPDGNLVSYREVHPETGSDLWFVSTDGTSEPRPFLQTAARETTVRFSPDGVHVAYASDASGRNEVYVAPMDRSDRRVKVSSEGGVDPHWDASGRRLFYVLRDKIMVVNVLIPGRSFSRPEVAFEGKDLDEWSLRPDGEAIYATTVADPPKLNLVLNWTAEVRRLMQ